MHSVYWRFWKARVKAYTFHCEPSCRISRTLTVRVSARLFWLPSHCGTLFWRLWCAEYRYWANLEDKQMKLPISWPWRPVVGVVVSLHSFLTSTLDAGKWSVSFWPLIATKEPQYPPYRRLDGPHMWCGYFWRWEKSVRGYYCTKLYVSVQENAILFTMLLCF